MDYEALYQELQHSTEMLRAMLSGITQAQAQVKPSAESWSILEVLCHLYDIEREDFREHVAFILHRQHQEWHEIDPQAWITGREYNEQDFVRMQERFFEDRQQSLVWLRKMSTADWGTVYTSQFGSTTAGEIFACWIAHDNLHIRQLAELRRLRVENMTRPYNLDYAGEW